MRSRILFVSKNKKQSAKQIAEAISQGAKIANDPVEKHTAVTNVDILFLGCELFFGRVPGAMKKMAKKCDPSQVKQVVAFTVGSSPDKTAIPELKAILEPKGIKVSERHFFSKKKITDAVIKEAKEFGASVIADNKKG